MNIPRRIGLRKAVRDKTQGICALCGKYDAKGEADHVIALWCGGADSISNMQWLCRTCHKRKTISEAPVRAKADRLRERAELTKRRRRIG